MRTSTTSTAASELFQNGDWDTPFAIENWKSHNSGALRGFFDVVLPVFTFKSCKLFCKGGRYWIALPDRTYTKTDGSIGYSATVTIEDRAKSDLFRDRVLDALRLEEVIEEE